MDRDVIARVPRLGRQAAEALVAAIEHESFDPSAIARLFDQVVRVGGGIASLSAILSILDAPLLISQSPDSVIDEIEAVEGTQPLDLVLKRTAQRAVVCGWTKRQTLVEFFISVGETYAVGAKGGVLASRGAEFVLRHREAIRSVVLPSAQRAADVLLSNPRAQVLGLMNAYRLGARDDLLGGAGR